MKLLNYFYVHKPFCKTWNAIMKLLYTVYYEFLVRKLKVRYHSGDICGGKWIKGIVCECMDCIQSRIQRRHLVNTFINRPGSIEDGIISEPTEYLSVSQEEIYSSV
jgi:hypothetical protein